MNRMRSSNRPLNDWRWTVLKKLDHHLSGAALAVVLIDNRSFIIEVCKDISSSSYLEVLVVCAWETILEI